MDNTSNLELKIKELEHQLNIKNAFLNVQISFPKNIKITTEAKAQVEVKLKELCNKLADAQEVILDNPNALSGIEVNILKQLADKVLQKVEAKPMQQAPKETVPSQPLQKAPLQGSIFKQAKILTAENLDKGLKSLIDQLSPVKIIKQIEDQYLVEDSKKNSFLIPRDDVEILE